MASEHERLSLHRTVIVALAIMLALSVAMQADAQQWPPADQVFHPASLPDPKDRDEADAVLRRVGVLIAHLETLPGCPSLAGEKGRLAELQAAAGTPDRAEVLKQACLLRRKVAFSNPLLNFDRILFIKRHFCPNDEKTGNHMCDQYFGFNAIRGGGLFVLEKPFSDQPGTRNVLDSSVCQSGRLSGEKLTANGGFLSPDLSFDGKEILFAWTEIADKEEDRRRYQTPCNEHNTYKIFRVGVDGSGLRQLTDGIWNDFDPCFLPNGRIMFISERRGGFGRCHGRPVPSFTLHSMNPDGSDVVCLSPHETNEWQPSVDSNGMVVYTRWDYVDRGFNQAHHAWITTPDGRDPRVINGNYSANQGGRPHFEISVRAIPGSPKYMATAACHHGQAYGSIILLDPRVPDDNAMSQVKRLTPDQLFPESEIGTHGPPANYAAPFPLSEYFFLCVYDPNSSSAAGTGNNYGIYLVDAFGNKELLYRDPAISCLDPIPMRPRPRPPVLPHAMLVGKPPLPNGQAAPVIPADQIPKTAIVGVMNVYDSTRPFPAGTQITALRIWQLMPKTTPFADNPRIGCGDQKGAKASLGTVPVEKDGSAYWEQPVGIPVLFHALDEKGMAVQGMRSATYVHPGETLMCNGCHERRATTPKLESSPMAFRRAPSPISADPDGTRPFSFARLVQPVLDGKCVACHQKDPKAPDLSKGNYAQNPNIWYTSFINLRPFVRYYNDAGWEPEPSTIPGQFGARASRLYALLAKGHHDLTLTPEEMLRLTIWLDSNGLFFGHENDLRAQADGKVVQPTMN